MWNNDNGSGNKRWKCSGHQEQQEVSSRKQNSQQEVPNRKQNLQQEVPNRKRKLQQKNRTLSGSQIGKSRDILNRELVLSKAEHGHGFAFNYRPPTNLREGNDFTSVCHSVHRGGVGIFRGKVGGMPWPKSLLGMGMSGRYTRMEGTLLRSTPCERYTTLEGITPEEDPQHWHLVVTTEAAGSSWVLSCLQVGFPKS